MGNDDTGMATLLAWDQGGTTGWSVMCVDPAALVDPGTAVLDSIHHWSQGEIVGPEEDQVEEFAWLMDTWDRSANVIERFILRKFLPTDELLSPVRLGFMLRYMSRKGWVCLDEGGVRQVEPRPFVFQNPDAAMTTATDERLKEWGLYLADGREHARDATRHALTLFRNAKQQRSRKLLMTLWPHLFGPGAPWGPPDPPRRTRDTHRQP